jgi:hydrogenase expression/formation protein HypC
MCLAVPGRIVSRDEAVGIVDIRGNRLRAGLALVPEAKVGDWVLVHAGFAITQVTAQDAAETNAILDQIDELAGEVNAPPRPLGRDPTGRASQP